MAVQTARTLITRSLRDLGVLAMSEAPTGGEAADALLKLNELLEAWSLERLMVYSINEVTHALTGASSYTIGSTGTINTARPLRIENALVRDSAGLDVPVAILTRDEYAAIALKGLASTYPYGLYYDHAYPLGTLRFYPVPGSGVTLHLWLWQPLTAIATLDTSINLPPGYSRALRTHLAADLAPEYGRELSPALVAVGIAAKEAIKSQRVEEVVQPMQLDDWIPQRHGRRWDIWTGGV